MPNFLNFFYTIYSVDFRVNNSSGVFFPLSRPCGEWGFSLKLGEN